METPDLMDPLYELSGCLDHEPNRCRECGYTLINPPK